jgi:hypothetical protein
MISPAPATSSPRLADWLKLALFSGLLAGIWLIVLPQVATVPPIQRHIRSMQKQNIAVDAMFYTELDWDPPNGAAWR